MIALLMILTANLEPTLCTPSSGWYSCHCTKTSIKGLSMEAFPYVRTAYLLYPTRLAIPCWRWLNATERPPKGCVYY